MAPRSPTSAALIDRHAPRLRRVIHAFLLVTLVLGALDSCSWLRKKRRRFGSTCGQASECETGLCYSGFCSTTCSNGKDCKESGVCIENVCQSPDLDDDFDGLVNKYEVSLGLNPSKKDTDDDGLDDGDEVGLDLNHPKDHNADGIPDAVQSNLIDSDGDCIVDAWDVKKGEKDPLPAAGSFCNKGICKGNLNQVVLSCEPGKTATSATDGCVGCVCTAPTVSGWQADETACDVIDNDCDGATDELIKLGDKPLGGNCPATIGACAVAGKIGKVECGPNKAPICSTDGGGSQASGSAELCNGQDDDCNGQTDEKFELQGAKIGAACPGCEPSGLTCPDGKKPLNPPLVTCAPNGQAAVCGAIPFAKGFELVGKGAPEPRRTWTVAWNEVAQKVHVVDGAVASVYGATPRAEHWDLFVENPTAKAHWAIHPADTQGPRSDAALIADPKTTDVYLVGGTSDGQFQTAIWKATTPGEWQRKSVSAINAELPELPTLSPTSVKPAPTTGIVLASAGGRVMVVFDRRYVRPLWHKLTGKPTTWLEPKGGKAASSAEVRCVATGQDLAQAVAVNADGSWTQLAWDGEQLTATAYQPAGDSAVAELAACAIDGQGKLHILGGADSDGTVKAHRIADLAWGLAPAATVTLADDPTVVVQAVARTGATATWSAKLQAIVIAGGWLAGPNSRSDRPDVVAYKPDSNTVVRLDAAKPRARFGHAVGWWPQQKALCIAGGLTLEVPLQDNKPRALPVGDAWCLGPDGQWVSKVAAGVKYAFGAFALDPSTQRMVLVGGMELKGTGEINNITMLWTVSGVMQNGVAIGALQPTNAVRAIQLGTKLDAPATVVDETVAKGVATPYLAAPGFAHDPVRRRLILYGGYGMAAESTQFVALHLGKMAWTDLGAVLGPKDTGGKIQIPPARFGQITLYNPYTDLFSITAGWIRVANFGPGFDQSDPPVGLPSPVPCASPGYTHFWQSSTLAAPAFAAVPVPCFANPAQPTKETMLLKPYGAGPVFVPVLYDALGNRAWMAVPRGPQPSPDAMVCSPLGPSSADPLAPEIMLSLDGGLCGGKHVFQLNPKPLDPVPDALFATASQYFDTSRQGWITGGLHPDGTASGGAWRLGTGCK